MLLATKPGDLVLDPTCGSGTAAYVAEQWGRRWITCDTSRVALAIARHRLLTAAFEWYTLRHPSSGVAGGFRYKTVPHVTLKSIAQNEEIDQITAETGPGLEAALAAVNQAFGREWLEWQVPRPDDRHGTAQAAALSEYWRLKQGRQQRIDGSIRKRADQEELVDQPEVERGITRVSGPFTVEGVPQTAEISLEVAAPELLETSDGTVELTAVVPPQSAANAASYVADMVEKLKTVGVHVRGRKIVFETLSAVGHPVICAEGEFTLPDAPADDDTPDEAALRGRRVWCAVVFGPSQGAVSENLVLEAIRAARPYDAVLFCGYDFTAPAQEVVNSDPVPGKRLLMAYIHPDTAMAGLLKDTKASQLFTMVGEPDVLVYRHDDPALAQLLTRAGQRGAGDVAQRAAMLRPGEVFVEVIGVDLYDPRTGEVSSDRGANVHAIFIDQDYDGRCFCVCQALFPNRKDSWDKIARNLRGTIEEEAFEAMRSQVSLPFKPGGQRRVQVKVIDARGAAVVKTLML
jgi:adenine-specific DNA-methyltransferase